MHTGPSSHMAWEGFPWRPDVHENNQGLEYIQTEKKLLYSHGKLDFSWGIDGLS